MAKQGDLTITDSNLVSISIPDDLAFDDSPVLPEAGSRQEPTPANALRLWREGADRSARAAAAVAAIAAADPGRVAEQDIGNIEACLVQAMGEAPAGIRRQIQLARCAFAVRRKDYALALELLDALADENESASDRRRRLEQRVQILQGLGERDEADRLRRNLRIDDLLDADVPSLDLRSQALELFVQRHYAEAERIYLHLVKRGYDLDSTHCHLARVCLMQDRFDDAFRHLDVTEQHCRAQAYVRARTIFFRILQRCFDQQPTGSLLAQLRQTLSEPGAFEDWIMEPVIEHLRLKERLSAGQIEVLKTLVKVLSNVTNLPQLDTVSSLDTAPTLAGRGRSLGTSGGGRRCRSGARDGPRHR
jgi:tetratricopeptide (TPR) repeat protein